MFQNPKDVLFIDIQKDPITVVRQIDRCEMILSTSLHGVIFAHALNIPSVWMELSEKAGSREYKFADYYSAFNMKPVPYILGGNDRLIDIEKYANKPLAEKVEDVNHNLDLVFCKLRFELLG